MKISKNRKFSEFQNFEGFLKMFKKIFENFDFLKYIFTMMKSIFHPYLFWWSCMYLWYLQKWLKALGWHQDVSERQNVQATFYVFLFKWHIIKPLAAQIGKQGTHEAIRKSVGPHVLDAGRSLACINAGLSRSMPVGGRPKKPKGFHSDIVCGRVCTSSILKIT